MEPGWAGAVWAPTLDREAASWLQSRGCCVLFPTQNWTRQTFSEAVSRGSVRTKADFLTESRTFCPGQVVGNFLSLYRHPDQACISYISPCELVQYVHRHSTLTTICDIWYNCCRCHFHTYLTAKYKKFNWLFCCWLLFTCLCQQKQHSSSNMRLETGWVSFQFIKRRQF